MATKQSTVDFVLEQIAEAGNVTARKMFGEYALYCDEKVVGIVAPMHCPGKSKGVQYEPYGQ